jgi:UDP-N-acetylmuramate dehydrogenase
MTIALIDAESRNWLAHQTSGRVRYDEPMSRHTSFRIGGPAEAYIEVQTAESLISLVSGLSCRKIPYHILGGGTNLIVTDAGISGVVIRLTSNRPVMTIENDDASQTTVRVWAGTALGVLCSQAIRNGLKGMNFALGIPGTVGGAIRMNAGTALGSMADVVASVTVLFPNGQMETIGRDNLCFSYRRLRFPQTADENRAASGTVILSGCFVLSRSSATVLKQEAADLLKKRRQRQPVHLPSAGCIFKNPPAGKTAGELIDLCGWKGRSIGGAEISMKHANFIVNKGTASAADVLTLLENVRNSVFQNFNVHLETEVIVIGN